MPSRLNAHARGEVNSVSAGSACGEELSRHDLETPVRRASHARAQRPQRSPVAILRSLFIEPAPVKAHVVVEPLCLEIERVMQKGRVGGGQRSARAPDPPPILQQHRQDEGAGVIVGAIALPKSWAR